MSIIEPGTPVRVIIEGTLDGVGPNFTWLHTGDGTQHIVGSRDPAVQVLPVDPEQVPLEWIIAAHVETSDIDSEQCACDWSSEEVTHVEHLAGELRAWAAKGGTLIEAAHPGLIR